MVLPLSAAFRSAFRAFANAPRSAADPCWSTDHI
jgi:hypothetical protein